MAKTPSLTLILYFTILLISSTSLLTKGKPNGLTLELIHRDSLESPLFPGNLTAAERHLRSFQRTTLRANSTVLNPDAIQVATSIQQMSVFMIQIRIGTLPQSRPDYISYFLTFDTSSNFTWLQCETCHSCFRQEQPLFPSSSSTTYRPVLRRREPHLCKPGPGEFCQYNLTYAYGASTSGVVAREKFVFGSYGGGWHERTIIFGCGLNQKKFSVEEDENYMSGVMGAGWGGLSIVDQLESNGRFSYCIPPPQDGQIERALIYFGADLPHCPWLNRTRLLRHGTDYLVNMVGINLGNERLLIDPNVFRRHGDSEGSIIDTGAEITVLIEPAFAALKHALRSRVPRIRLIPGGVRPWKACFTVPQSWMIEHMPSVTFHLEGGDIVVEPRNAYVYSQNGDDNNHFCLAKAKMSSITMIGAFQQANHRFIFDTVRHELSFGPEACGRVG